MKLINNDIYLLLIDEEAEIKPDDYIIHDTVEGIVEANDEWDYRGEKDDYWNKAIAYRKLNENAKELDLPLLPKPTEKEIDIEKLAEENNRLIGIYKNDTGLAKSIYVSAIKNFKDGYKAAQAKGQYSLEDIKVIAIKFAEHCKSLELLGNHINSYEELYDDSIEEIGIQSLSTQQLPKEFIPEYEYKEVLEKVNELSDKIGVTPRVTKLYKTLKTIINSKGKEELVGKYQY